MYDTVVKILVEILSVLALATNQIKQGQFSEQSVSYISLMANPVTEKFAKKLLGESDVEAVLQRLDRLTLEDARMTAAQTLAVVHGLINNMRVVLDGMQTLSFCHQSLTRLLFSSRWQSTDG